MQHIATQLSSIIPAARGGRVSSPELRYSIQCSEEFAGLEEGTSHYDLLVLVKRAGKMAGFTPKMIQLLDYYMAFTRDVDWEEGARPIVYQSVSKTALDLGVSERQIQRLEQELFQANAITWNDSGNHQRYGQRCKGTGRILYAFGVELTPLAFLKPELEARLHAKQLADRAWMETKRQISYYRRQICAVIAEAEEGGQREEWLGEAKARYARIAVQIRTHIELSGLRALLAAHRDLWEKIEAHVVGHGLQHNKTKTQKQSPMSDGIVARKDSTNQKPFIKMNCRPQASCFQESVTEPPEPPQKSEKGDGKAGREELAEDQIVLSSGLQHITLKQALNAASERFKARIPMARRAMDWNDFAEAAHRLKPELHIGQENWAHACDTLGRAGAAICLLLTDQGMQREADPVRKPGAYFRAMLERAKTGDLHLHNSIFGILKRESEEGSAVEDWCRQDGLLRKQSALAEAAENHGLGKRGTN